MASKSTDYTISEIARCMTRVHAKALMVESIANRGLLETSLTSGNLSSFLLSEAEDEEGAKFTESDATEIQASIDSMKKSVEELKTALDKAPGKFPNTIKAVEALQGEIPAAGDLASLAIKGDAKALSKQVEEINTALSNVGKAAASIIGAAEMFAQNLAPVMKVIKDEDKEKSLEELSNTYADNPDVKFPDLATLKKGAAKAVAVPSWFQQAFQGGMDAAKAEAGGFFAAVGSFFKGLFGDKETGIDPNTFAEEVVKCTPAELDEVLKAVADVKGSMETAVEDSAESTTAGQAGAEQAKQAEEGGGEDLKGADTETIVAALLAALKKLDPAAAKEFEEAGKDKAMEALEDEAEEIKAGDATLEDAAEDAAEEGLGGLSWEDVSGAVKGAVDDTKSAEAVLSKLGADNKFKDALKDKVKFAEGYVPDYARSLSSMLYEEVGFEDFASMGGVADLGDDVDKQQVAVQIAKALNVQFEDDVITDVPDVEESDPNEPPPASEEEAAEEQDEAQSELEGAVQDATKEDSPGAAIMAAIDGWYDGLSPTSQKSMDTKDRIGSLKTNLQTAIEGAAETLAKAVGDAVAQWRSQHEETLVKSKRFAKKNFDSLENLIPQLAGELLKKTNESGTKLTRGMVNKFVFRALDKHFGVKSGVLNESLIPLRPINQQSQRSSYRDAWQKIAGLPYDSDYETPAEALAEDRYVYNEEALIAEKWRRIAGIPEER